MYDIPKYKPTSAIYLLILSYFKFLAPISRVQRGNITAHLFLKGLDNTSDILVIKHQL